MSRPADLDRFKASRGILLDFGGTLDSDGEHWLDRFYDLYERAGIGVPRPEIKRVFYHADGLCYGDSTVFGLGLRPLMRRHVRLQLAELGLDAPEKQEQLVEGFCSKTEFFLSRNASLLTRLARRYRLGVVSNFYGNVATLCREAGLAESLDVILDSAQIGVSKPDPAIFRMALARLELEPDEAIFVGDSYERDMMPARRVGMKTLWLKGPNARFPQDPEPVDSCISNLTELESLLS